MKLAELWRSWQTRGYPEHMLTKAEAIERVRQYAEANSRDFRDPFSVHIERRMLDPENRKAGFRFVYALWLGTDIPMPIVEVDAITGEVLRWLQPVR